MPSASRIAHAGLPFANPMCQQAVDAAIAALPLPTEPLVADTGCGGGEILLRTLQLHPAARGVGVDLDADAIAEARQRTKGRSARFEVGDAATVDGTFDVVINVGSSHAHGGFPAALEALRALARVVLYGEGFWRRHPSEDFLAALGGATIDELSDYDGLRAAIGDAGFDIVQAGRRSPQTPNATARPRPSPTRAGSAIGAHCPEVPTHSASRCLFCAPDPSVICAGPHCRIRECRPTSSRRPAERTCVLARLRIAADTSSSADTLEIYL